jgi:hypothetical protein
MQATNQMPRMQHARTSRIRHLRKGGIAHGSYASMRFLATAKDTRITLPFVFE